MKKIIARVKEIQLTDVSVPWILLTACLLAFGPFLSKLGYFQDDWNVVYNAYAFDSTGIIGYFQHDGRPFASWIYLVGFPLVGFKPLAWQVSALIMRWLTSVMIWMIFNQLWPKAHWQNLTSTLIFVLYPFFTIQPMAETYIHHWTGYFLYSLSVYLMLRATKKQFWLNSLFALIFQALHLLTHELYAGIDLLRPVFLWLVISSTQQNNRNKIKSVTQQWIPYLIVFMLYFIWRGFFYHAATAGRNIPVGVIALLSNPLTAIQNIILNAIPDYALVLVSSWYKIFDPSYLNFSVSANRYIFIMSFVSAIIFFIIQSKHTPSSNQDPPNKQLIKQMLIVGLLALIMGMAPAYAAGFVVHDKIPPWNSRLSLGSLYGAALIVTATLDVLITVPRKKWIVLSTLIGLLIGWHLQYTNDFRWAWEKQVNFYRQLYLRAPEIIPDTAIISEQEFLMYMGGYPTSYGINLIYAPKGDNFEGIRRADYWFFPLIEFYNSMEQHINGEPFSKTRAGLIFEGDPKGSIVISFEPELGQCLWVMRPEYASSKALSQTTRQLASISYVDRIRQAPENPDSFLLKYLYTSPRQDWCYYYQKADLAYQYEEWDKVIQLWQSAKQSDLRPENGFEYLPFIEAYAHTGDWASAKKFTLSSQVTMQGIDPLLCNIWDKLDNNTPTSTEKENTIISIKDELRCE